MRSGRPWLGLLPGCLTVVAALVVPAARLDAGAEDPAPGSIPKLGGALGIDIVWDDPCSELPVPSAWAGRELSDQFPPLGVVVRWGRAAPCAGTPPETCRVILLARNPLADAQGRGTLGFARRDSSFCSVWLLLAATRRTLGLPLSAEVPLSAGQRRALACALGRVAAHELVHVLVPELAHARSGLMQARLDRRLLTEPGARFDAATGRGAAGCPRSTASHTRDR